MSDIVERLRQGPTAAHEPFIFAEMREAANEIERLRWKLSHTTLVADAEIERLKAALRPFANAAATINYKWGNLREDYRAVLLVDCERARDALEGK